ncbi:HD domain-containing protein [Fundidesulfovibrio butyratiphilus]
MRMSLLDMIGCLSAAMDLVSPAVVGHHGRVSSIAGRLGQTLGLDDKDWAELILAGLVHDVGAFSLQDRLQALAFDAWDRTHAEVGFRLLHGHPRLARAAELVRRHHDPWTKTLQSPETVRAEAELANLLCLADRVDTQLPRASNKGVDRKRLIARLRQGADKSFNPLYVQAFEDLAADSTFWSGLDTPHPETTCALLPDGHNPRLEPGEVRSLSRLFSQVIDFRSRFTATHSLGVAATAVALGREMGMDSRTLSRLGLAGELHDLGKLGVPAEIIMKPAALTEEETRLMRNHALFGHAALCKAPGFETVAGWVVNHHERLDGKGYPHQVVAPGLDLGSRVLAIADIFTALAEDRPYRAGMALPSAVRIMEDSARMGAHDPDVTLALIRRLDVVDAARRKAQDQARTDFQRFAASCGQVRR